MELIDRYGGLGVISLTQNETKKVQTLNEIISKNGIKDFLGRDSPRTPEYIALMEELFPAFPLSYNLFIRTTDRFLDKKMSPLGRCEELVINSKFPIKGNRMFSEAELSIILPNGYKNTNFLITVCLNPSYKLDVVDDIVSLLGQRENPTVSAPQEMIYFDHFKPSRVDWKDLGFAEVPSLSTIRMVYNKAMYLVNNSERIVSCCRKDLDVLRHDAAEHPNLVIREQSKSMYNHILETLTNQ